MILELDRDSWHVRLYHWSERVRDSFISTNSQPVRRTNLCMYLRTLFVWMPLALLAQVWLVGLVFYTFIYFPLANFGLFSMVRAYVIVVLIIGSILAYYRYKKYRKEQAAMRSEPALPAANRGPGLLTVVMVYLRAAKQKICPFIEFSYSKKGDA